MTAECGGQSAEVPTLYSVGEGHHGSMLASALGNPLITSIWPSWQVELGGEQLCTELRAETLTRCLGFAESRLFHRQDLTLTLSRMLHGRFSEKAAAAAGSRVRIATVLHAGRAFQAGGTRILDFPMCPPITWEAWRHSDGVGFANLRSPWSARLAAREATREVSRATIVVAMSTFARDQIELQWPGASVVLIPPGVTVVDERRNLRGNGVAYVGAISYQKGLGDLLTALELHPDVTLRCAGAPTAASGDLLRRLESRPNTEYLGVLGPTGRDELMRSAAVVVVPSHHEGFGLVILEAMAVGTPVVATTSTGACDAGVDSCGWLVPPGDPERLAEATLEALQESEAERRDRAALGRALLVERALTPQGFGKRWRALLDSPDPKA